MSFKFRFTRWVGLFFDITLEIHKLIQLMIENCTKRAFTTFRVAYNLEKFLELCMNIKKSYISFGNALN